MPPTNWTANSISDRYIQKMHLERLLSDLFPGETDFCITVRCFPEALWHGWELASLHVTYHAYIDCELG